MYSIFFYVLFCLNLCDFLFTYLPLLFFLFFLFLFFRFSSFFFFCPPQQRHLHELLIRKSHINLPTDERMIEERGHKAHWRRNVEMTETSQKPWNRWKFRVSRIPGSLVELLELFFVYHMWHSEQFFSNVFSRFQRSVRNRVLTWLLKVPFLSAPLLSAPSLVYLIVWVPREGTSQVWMSRF